MVKTTFELMVHAVDYGDISKTLATAPHFAKIQIRVNLKIPRVCDLNFTDIASSRHECHTVDDIIR